MKKFLPIIVLSGFLANADIKAEGIEIKDGVNSKANTTDIKKDNVKKLVKNTKDSVETINSYELYLFESILGEGATIKYFQKGKGRINARTSDGDLIFKELCSKGDIELIRKLLELKPELNIGSGKYGEYPLNGAIYSKNLEIVKMLVDAGSDLSLKSNWGSYLHYVITFGNEEIFDYLISKGMKIDDINENNNTLLISCLNHHEPKIMKKLIALGADINEISHEKYYKWTPMSRAVGSGDERMAKILLDSGAKIDFEHVPYILTDYIENAKFISNPIGVEDDRKNPDGSKKSKKIYRNTSDGIALLREFIGKGADLRLKDRFGNDALDEAIKRKEFFENLIANFKNYSPPLETENNQLSIKILDEIILILNSELKKTQVKYDSIINDLKKMFSNLPSINVVGVSSDIFSVWSNGELKYFCNKDGKILIDIGAVKSKDSFNNIFKWEGFGYSIDDKGVYFGNEYHKLYPAINKNSYEYYVLFSKLNKLLN
ncbi:MAG: ankyrin repeat domain-containing protein [Candidatus Gracilibacteria bacterium]|nr:ankyrin repeat domain-containing protein [Candidatus Gracilibacteria bacterium]MDD2908830.1 ankyrin repeat domain-containing protein [Candidatus Gracilibacteria bacterium]